MFVLLVIVLRSFSPAQVLYADGDEEILNLKKERWELVGDNVLPVVGFFVVVAFTFVFLTFNLVWKNKNEVILICCYYADIINRAKGLIFQNHMLHLICK